MHIIIQIVTNPWSCIWFILSIISGIVLIISEIMGLNLNENLPNDDHKRKPLAWSFFSSILIFMISLWMLNKIQSRTENMELQQQHNEVTQQLQQYQKQYHKHPNSKLKHTIDNTEYKLLLIDRAIKH